MCRSKCSTMLERMPDTNLTKTTLRTPKAAAIAGLVFSMLLIAVFTLLRFPLPTDPSSAIKIANVRAETIALAVGLIPFAGVAFLWFIGVVRDRLGPLEDRLFATVFLGSGLLFLAMLFCAGAVVGSTMIALSPGASQPMDFGTFTFARGVAFDLMNVYAIKMAAVFMITTSTVAAYTRFVPRYVAYLGYLLALLILLGSQYRDWSVFIFPIWVFLLSAQILVDNYRNVLQPRQ
jgi:hypothetical protein